MENFFGCKRPSSNWRLSVQICGESYCRTRRPEKSWSKLQLEQLYYVPAFATVGLPEYTTSVVQEEPNRNFTGIRVVDKSGEGDPATEAVPEPMLEPDEEEVHTHIFGCSFMMVMVNHSFAPLPQHQAWALEGKGRATLASHPIDVGEEESG